MKTGLLIAMLGFSSLVLADAKNDVDESILRTNSALKSYKETYVNQPQNKAFAQSPDGSWNWRSDRVTVDMAVEDALTACNRSLKKDAPPCVIVNINGLWIKPQ